MISKAEVNKRLESAEAGLYLMNSIITKYQLSSLDYIVLFPHGDSELNQLGIKYLKIFSESVKACRVIVIYVEDFVGLECQRSEEGIVHYVQVTKRDMENIICCYSMMDFSNHVLVVSLTLPDGRCGNKVVENGQMGFEEAVALGVYGLEECVR